MNLRGRGEDGKKFGEARGKGSRRVKGNQLDKGHQEELWTAVKLKESSGEAQNGSVVRGDGS